MGAFVAPKTVAPFRLARISKVEHEARSAQRNARSASARSPYDWSRLRVLLRLNALVRPPRQPPHHCDHSNPPNCSRSSADFLVLQQQSPLPKQNSPVVIPRTDQRQILRSRIRHIRPDVRKILEKPKHAKCRSRNLSPPKEISSARQRNNQLHQSPAQNHHRVPKHAKQRVPALVNHQIGKIQKKKAASLPRRINQEQNEKANPSDPGIARDRLPLPKILFEPNHATKVASPKSTSRPITQRSAESVQSPTQAAPPL